MFTFEKKMRYGIFETKIPLQNKTTTMKNIIYFKMTKSLTKYAKLLKILKKVANIESKSSLKLCKILAVKISTYI